MKFNLPYGRANIEIEIDNKYDPFLLPQKDSIALKDPNNVLQEKLRNPINLAALRDLAKPSSRVGIIVNDNTRPTPTAFLLPTILHEIEQVHKENITFFVATGSHRKCSNEELRRILGNGVATKYPVIQNDATNPSEFEYIGKSKYGNDIFINSKLMRCDLLISIGFIEPHFFAGFSGGLKNVLPGMASIESIMANHSPRMVDNSNATWGITDGNPIWEDINSLKPLVPQIFLVNVTLNPEKEIDQIFCGDVDKAHREGCAHVRNSSMVEVHNLFDVVITSNSGAPLDMNLYQTVKGMSAAGQIVKPGGAIVVFTECADGIPEHGCYKKLLREANSADELLENIYTSGKPVPDQWQAQIHGKLLKKANIFIFSKNLSDHEIRACLLKPFDNLPDLLASVSKSNSTGLKICIAPMGPLCVPYYSG